MNEHVHPTMAGVLNSFAALPQAANDAERVAAYRVKVSRADVHETFAGLYPSSADACMAGMERAGTPACAVSERRMA